MKKKRSPEKKKIDYRFKLLYALGMIFIVIGHGTGGISLDWGGWFPFYSFHLALFMFCSGYFYKLDSHEHVWQFIWKKIKRLIIPLFLWNLFYAAFVLLVSNFGFEIGMPVTIKKLTVDVITSGHQFMYNLGGWFVIPLFMCQVFTVLLRRLLKRYEGKAKEWLCASVYVFLGVVGLCLTNHGWGVAYTDKIVGDIGLPLVITRMLALMPFYGIGILYKTKLEKRDKLPNWAYFSIVFIVQLIMIIRNGGTVPTATQSLSIYSGMVNPIICGLTGIAFYLRIARVLEPVLGRSKILNKIADNSFAIMIHQFLGFWLVTLLFGLTLSLFRIGEFDWSAFRTDVFYKYYPGGQMWFGIIYIIAGIGIPILIQLAADKVKARFVAKTGSFSVAERLKRRACKSKTGR